MSTLALGAAIIFAAMLVAGVTGFGMGLVSVPLLLLVGLPLPQIVVVNMVLTILTRVPIVWRLHAHLRIRRVLQLVSGSVPGVAVGVLVVGSIDTTVLKVGAGVLVLAAATYLALRSPESPPRRLPAAPLVAGVAGGFLGTTVSLNGLPPALLLSHEQADAASFLADLAAYFVASSSMILIVLTANGDLEPGGLVRHLPLWLLTGLLGTFVGVRVASRLPGSVFRRLVLALVAVAGCVTVVTSV